MRHGSGPQSDKSDSSSDRSQHGESCGARSSPVAYSDRVKGLRKNGPSGRSREPLRSLRSGGRDVHGRSSRRPSATSCQSTPAQNPLRVPAPPQRSAREDRTPLLLLFGANISRREIKTTMAEAQRLQPAALHAADPRLHCQVQLQPHHQVR